MAKPTSITNFWDKVRKTDGCWLWTGATQGHYGTITFGGSRFATHRFAWELANGPVTDGSFVLHRCDTPLCVRPGHLFIGSHDDNMKDKATKGRSPRGVTNHASKLTEDDVRFVRRRYAEGGISQPELGRMFGVSHRAIGHIVHRKNWGWLT